MKNRIGKSEARARFLPLVQQVVSGAGPIEITDRGEVAAVLMGHKEYLRLLARAGESPMPRRSPVGLMEIVGDVDLEDVSHEISRQALESILKSAEDL